MERSSDKAQDFVDDELRIGRVGMMTVAIRVMEQEREESAEMIKMFEGHKAHVNVALGCAFVVFLRRQAVVFFPPSPALPVDVVE